MNHIIRDTGSRAVNIPAVAMTSTIPHQQPTLPLMLVLWRRRWVIVMTVIVGMLGMFAYLKFTTPVYSASGKIAVSQISARVMERDSFSQSETFLQTQADILTSTAVLKRALDSANKSTLAALKKDSTGDLIDWLRQGKQFKVEAARKSDVIMMSMESPDKYAAYSFIQNVIDAYRAEQTAEKKAVGGEQLEALSKQRMAHATRREQCLNDMLELKTNTGVMSFSETGRGNSVLEKTEKLGAALTEAELTIVDLRSQKESLKAAMSSTEETARYADGQQAKGRDSGDAEYHEMKIQLNTVISNFNQATILQGPNNPRVQQIQDLINALHERIAIKQRTMIEAAHADINTRLIAAEEKSRQIRNQVDNQSEKMGKILGSQKTFADLESESTHLQKMIGDIDSRIMSVKAESDPSGPMNIRMIEVPQLPALPIKPNKMVCLLGAMMVSALVGCFLALCREWKDARIHSPEEITSVLGTQVLATVPRIDSRLSATDRGQLVWLDSHSVAAEAYRSVRTSLYLGVDGKEGKAKTVLICSPMPGDGKSTSASNLAIAFAQAGDRTLVLDCDLREPVQHLIFEVNGAVGLSDVINDAVKLKDAVQATRINNLYVLPCGTQPNHPSELLGGKRFAQVIAMLSKSFDRIVIDSPPVLRFSDGRILASMADITVVCLRMNQSMRTLGVVALNGLDKVGANVVGAIANDVPASKAASYYGASSHYFTRVRHQNRSANNAMVSRRDIGSDTAPQAQDETNALVSSADNDNSQANGNGTVTAGSYVNGNSASKTPIDSLKIGDMKWIDQS